MQEEECEAWLWAGVQERSLGLAVVQECGFSKGSVFGLQVLLWGHMPQNLFLRVQKWQGWAC